MSLLPSGNRGKPVMNSLPLCELLFQTMSNFPPDLDRIFRHRLAIIQSK